MKSKDVTPELHATILLVLIVARVFKASQGMVLIAVVIDSNFWLQFWKFTEILILFFVFFFGVIHFLILDKFLSVLMDLVLKIHSLYKALEYCCSYIQNTEGSRLELKNFSNFTGKHPKEKASTQGFICDILRNI